ncbi:MAG: hypothetical protein ACRC56_01845, partial [Bosea sp. (in: a-proteobacteria)]
NCNKRNNDKVCPELCSNIGGELCVRPDFWRRILGKCFTASRNKTSQRKDREDDGNKQQSQPCTAEPAHLVESEIQTNDTMRPDNQQRCSLPERIVWPKEAQEVGVRIINVGKRAHDARADHMLRKHERDRKTKYKLQDFEQWHAPGAPAEGAFQRQCDMDKQSTKQQDSTRPAAPDSDPPTLNFGHCRDAEKPDRVVQQVAGDENHQDQPSP